MSKIKNTILDSATELSEPNQIPTANPIPCYRTLFEFNLPSKKQIIIGETISSDMIEMVLRDNDISIRCDIPLQTFKELSLLQYRFKSPF